ncbi:hypothetical protein Closa_0307 [[Clostridium] saccharolyticum WM1]|uniref:Uncharacterized protein n=1 Tax=Lacrimispora saccharolytica (strain ATCC 35040 / DSM 2544 / NRCC 2533 / WM1) TaxID=610130 RepID=D9R2V5_LACSW|nr:hypothetical protein Closa_0307 [[Clostridium] saccharolyticum WM1]
MQRKTAYGSIYSNNDTGFYQKGFLRFFRAKAL